MKKEIREDVGKIWEVCDNCGGRGEVPEDDPASPIGVTYKKCRVCGDSKQPGKVLQRRS